MKIINQVNKEGCSFKKIIDNIAEKIGAYLGLNDYISFEKDRLVNDTIYPADSLDMLRDFHWQPTRNLDDFLPETIEWYREHLEHFRHRI